MSRRTRTWLLVAAVLLLLGCILFGGGFGMADWDITKLGTGKYVTNDYTVGPEFTDITIESKTADVIFQPASDGKVTVECLEQLHAEHAVSVENGTLVIRLVDERKWYEHISWFNFTSPRITVSLPEGQYGRLIIRTSTGKVSLAERLSFDSADMTLSTGTVTSRACVTGMLKIKTNTGSISLQGVSVGTLELATSTGKITAEAIRCTGEAKLTVDTGDICLTDFRCKIFDAKTDTGDLLLTKVIVEEALMARTDTGKVKFDGCDAGELTVKTDTGSVTGSLLTPKIFFAQTDTGRVDVPKTTTGGVCEIITDTGSIRITVTESIG